LSVNTNSANYQLAEIALTGHSDSQAPQSTHFSASIVYLASPSEIASTGQTVAHAPHEVHLSDIV
jgi:hypothetical protein